MKIENLETSFWRHKSKKEGYAQIYCRISVNGQREDIGSTGITIRYDEWDLQRERVLEADPHAQFKNDKLLIIESHLSAIFNDLFRKRERITPGKIKRLYLGGSVNVTMASAFELYLNDCRADRERDLAGSSITVYDNIRKKLLDFLISEKALDLLAEEFDLDWLKRYRAWMTKIGHASSYVAKQSQTIKNVLIWARLKKLIDFNPLDGYRVKGGEYAEPVFLTKEEFERLRSHRFKNPHLQEVADVFILLCRTGFHYGDLKSFVQQHQSALQRGIDGETWLIKKRIKTKVTARVPQFAEVAEIVEKYGGWQHLPMRPLSKFNQWLKLVAAELGFHPDLSSKAGRKTFTDWCFNELNLTTDAVKVLLGRKSSKGLEVYGRPDERRVIHELEVYRKKKPVSRKKTG